MPVGESSLQLLEMIAGRHTKIGIGGGVIQHLQLSEQPGFQIHRHLLGSHILDKKSRSQASRNETIMQAPTHSEPMYRSMGHNASPLIGDK